MQKVTKYEVTKCIVCSRFKNSMGSWVDIPKQDILVVKPIIQINYDVCLDCLSIGHSKKGLEAESVI